MSWHLKPVKPSADAPIDVDTNFPQQAIYTMMGWFLLIRLLKKWKVDVSEFADDNEGRLICESTCKNVADTIEEHLPDLEPGFQLWLEAEIKLWRTCGGYEQW